MTSIQANILFTIIAILTLSTSTPLYALSTTLEVSPMESEVGGFRFEIKTKKINKDEIAFQVEIKEETARFSTAPDLSLGTIDKTDNSVSISSTRELEFNRKNRVIETTFNVLKKTVSNRRNYFIFTNHSEDIRDGKVVRMPSSDFYIVRLNSFVPKQTHWIYIIITLVLAVFYFGIKTLRSNRKSI